MERKLQAICSGVTEFVGADVLSAPASGEDVAVDAVGSRVNGEAVGGAWVGGNVVGLGEVCYPVTGAGEFRL